MRRINGRLKARQVQLGRAEELMSEKLWPLTLVRSPALECKPAGFMAEGGNQGQIQALRQREGFGGCPPGPSFSFFAGPWLVGGG